MDVKVYKKETVKQPSGVEDVFVPDVIDLIPVTVEVEATDLVRNNVWSLDLLKKIADVEIRDNKLIINSDKVRYENGNLYVTLNTEQILTCEILEEGSRELLEQEVALATIFQKGLDPLDKEDGISWSEALLGEINVVQLMDEIQTAVENTTTSVTVDFEVVQGANGRSYLSYVLREVA